MKKGLFLTLLVATLIISLTSCSSDSQETAESPLPETAESLNRIAPPTPTAEPPERQAAVECLSQFYPSDEIISVIVSGNKVEATVLAPFSAAETPPEGWEAALENLLDSSAAMQNSISEFNANNAIVYLVDSNGDIFLTVFNGTVSYDRYEEPEPSPEVTPTPVNTSDTSAKVTMVWISEDGNRYHSKSSCSGMNNPYQVTISQAIAAGRTPCGKCY